MAAKGKGPTQKGKRPTGDLAGSGLLYSLRSLLQPTRTPRVVAAAAPVTGELFKGLAPQSAKALLATPRRQRLLEHIWQRTALSRHQFAALYQAPLEHYAALVQAFPASEAHHHAYPGGMLDHGLEVVAYALKLRQTYLLPAGLPPEDQAPQADAWTAATAYAALLHDLGKIAVDLHVEQADGTIWHPWQGPLTQMYRFRYREDREYRLHGAASGLLHHHVLDRPILDWLSDYPTAWSALIYVLAGQYEHAGPLGELVIQADKASVALALGGNSERALAAPKNSLHRHLIDGLRYLLREELRLNQAEASDGWLTGEALWLVSKTVSDKLRAHLLAAGIEGVPSGNTALFNVMQDNHIIQPAGDGKAIWRATIRSDSGWSHTLTLLRVAPALIWEADRRPMPFTGTVIVEAETPSTAEPSSAETSPETSAQPATASGADATKATEALDSLLTLLDAPADNAAPPPSPVTTDEHAEQKPSASMSPLPPLANGPAIDAVEPLSPALHFMAWLKRSISMHKLIINDAKALVHTVSDTVFLVSPGLFQRYAQEHPPIAQLAKANQLSDWLWLQKHFEKLHRHRKQDNGLNIWTCDIKGPRKTRRIHGYLLQSPADVFDELPPNNPYLEIQTAR